MTGILQLIEGFSYTTAEGDTDDWGEMSIGGTYNLGGTANITAEEPASLLVSDTLKWPIHSFTVDLTSG